jgi:hypothetical protein
LPAQQFKHTCFVDGQDLCGPSHWFGRFSTREWYMSSWPASPHADIVHRIRSGKRIVVARQSTTETSRTCEHSRCGTAPRRARRRGRARRAMSPLGTLETCRRALRMSADRGTALSQNDATDSLGHQRPPKFSSRGVFKVSRLRRYNCRILIFGVGMRQREFSLGLPAANSAGWNHSA